MTKHDDLLPETCRLIEGGIDAGLHLGMQVAVSVRMQPVANFAIGNDTPERPLTGRTLMPWMSSGKPVTAVAALKFVEAGELSLERPVADVVPEFAQSGKREVTLRHMLTHTVGLRPVVSGWPHLDWEQIVQRICRAGLQDGWEPGRMGGYDPARTWFILGEMLQRIDGRPVERIVREEVLEPLGMIDSWMAIPPDRYEAYGERIGVMHSLKEERLVPTHGHEIDVCGRPSPGGSMRGPVRELGLLYEMLLRRGTAADGTRILKPETVAMMTRRQRAGLVDRTFSHIVDFGLGVIINSNRYGKETVPYGFGRFSSEETFGHGGAQSSIGFADPERELVVAAVANGAPGEAMHHRRFRDLLSAIYEDLGLAG